MQGKSICYLLRVLKLAENFPVIFVPLPLWKMIFVMLVGEITVTGPGTVQEKKKKTSFKETRYILADL